MQILAIIGLGNPGARYERSRHNMGFMVLDHLAREMGLTFSRSRFDGLTAWWELGDRRCLLLKPQTFMNLSGKSVVAATHYHRILPEDTLVIHDDMDMPLGRLRFSRGGGTGGHNGLNSIVESWGTRSFHRFKLGVGHPEQQERVVEHVLTPFSAGQGAILDQLWPISIKAVHDWASDGMDAAMNRTNGIFIV